MQNSSYKTVIFKFNINIIFYVIHLTIHVSKSSILLILPTSNYNPAADNSQD